MRQKTATDTQYWLMKSEPGSYSIEDLRRDKTTFWDGVRNYQVRNMLRDEMRVGDLALFYHSNAGENTGVVGVIRITREAETDPTQFDKKDPHYDPKATKVKPRWWGREVRFIKKFKQLVSLAQIKAEPKFAHLPLVKPGNRLSIMPIDKKSYDRLVELGG